MLAETELRLKNDCSEMFWATVAEAAKTATRANRESMITVLLFAVQVGCLRSDRQMCVF